MMGICVYYTMIMLLEVTPTSPFVGPTLLRENNREDDVICQTNWEIQHGCLAGLHFSIYSTSTGTICLLSLSYAPP